MVRYLVSLTIAIPIVFNIAFPKIAYSKSSSEKSVADFILNYDFRPGDAIFLDNQNSVDLHSLFNRTRADKGKRHQTIEFKKISPVKYRLRFHDVRTNFNLIFSESFHSAWMVYPIQSTANTEETIHDLRKYDFMPERPQLRDMSKMELKKNIKRGHVSSLTPLADLFSSGFLYRLRAKKRQGTSIGFISKKYHDTIQNDNLPDGSIFETVFRKPLPNTRYQLLANGYANSWFFDLEYIQSNYPGLLTKQPDDSYDFEVIIFFRIQLYYYIGWFITLLTAITCFLYGIYSFYQKKYGLSDVGKTY